jgi:hypothetical protein
VIFLVGLPHDPCTVPLANFRLVVANGEAAVLLLLLLLGSLYPCSILAAVSRLMVMAMDTVQGGNCKTGGAVPIPPPALVLLVTG